MMRIVASVLSFGLLVGCAVQVDGRAAPEVLVTRGADARGAGKIYQISIGDETAELAAGDAARLQLPPGRYTLTATTEPPRLDLRDFLDIAPLDRTWMPLGLYPGSRTVIEVETGPFGGPRLIRRPASNMQ